LAGFRVRAKDWLGNHALAEEVFGPLGLIVTAESLAEMRGVACSLAGQLTVPIYMDEADTEAALNLLPILERKAGRVLANGFSTGVEVCDAMVHGGPYPAFTNFGATSVGTLSIQRWLRPFCHQNLPESVLTGDLQAGAASSCSGACETRGCRRGELHESRRRVIRLPP